MRMGSYFSVADDTGNLRIRFTIAGKPMAVALRDKATGRPLKGTDEDERQARKDYTKLVDGLVLTNNLPGLCKLFPWSKPLALLRSQEEFAMPELPPTLGEFIGRWFDSLAGNKLSTLAAYDSIYEHWIKPCPLRNAAGKVVGQLVDRRLDQFTAIDGDQFHQWLASKDGPETDAVRNKALAQLRRIFAAARVRKSVTGMVEDPLLHLKLFKLDSAARRKAAAEALSAWNDREVQALIEAAYSLNPQWGAIVEVAFFTGLRRGELLGLKWDDLDFAAKRITINQTLRPSPVREGSRLAERIQRTGIGVIEDGYQYVSTPKTTGSLGTVEMLPRVEQALREQRLRVQLRSREGWVFSNREGDALSLNNFARDHWRVIVQKAGVAFRSFEQTRHTFAQLVLTYGGTGDGNLEWLRGMMRHTNLNMLINHYLKHSQRSSGRPAYLGGPEATAVAEQRVWARFGQRPANKTANTGN